MRRLLVASRAGTALRVARSARTLGVVPVGVVTAADRDSLWTRALDDLVEVEVDDDVAALVSAAQALGADALHPGTGGTAESPALARAVTGAGLTWVGAPAHALEVLSDKLALADLAARTGVPAPLSLPASTPEELDVALERLPGPVVLKTVRGGGGRGVVTLPAAHAPGAPTRPAGAGLPTREAAARAALASLTGLGPLLAQEAVVPARHVEVQVLADAAGRVVTLGTRECSAQRRAQKIIEEAPAPFLPAEVVTQLEERARALVAAAGLVGAATCEVLVPWEGGRVTGEPLLLEVNARLQVEHAVTEEVTGTDLVRAQLLLAQGAELSKVLPGLGPRAVSVPVRAHAVEARVYAEDPSTLLPEAGDVLGVSVPVGLAREREGVAQGRGPGPVRLRTQRSLLPGDALVAGVSEPLALLTTTAPSRQKALEALDETLSQVRVRGVRTLVPLLREALAHPGLRAAQASGYEVTTRWVEEVLRPGAGDATRAVRGDGSAPAAAGTPGSTATLPPAALSSQEPSRSPGGPLVLRAPMAGTVVAVDHGPVRTGQAVVVLEAMKMRVPVAAPSDGHASPTQAAVVGTSVRAGEPLATLTPAPGAAETHGAATGVEGRDRAPSSGPHPVRPRTHRSAVERVTALADPGSLTDLVVEDAVLTVRGHVDGREVLVWAQDPTVMGGTIGLSGARRVAALIDTAADEGLPVLSLLDGGGARVQEGVDALAGTGLVLAAQTRARGRTLQVGLVLGAAAGGAAYSPALTDVLVMVEGQGQVFLTGPAVLSASTGERVDAEALGGYRLHAEQAGTVHLTAPDEAGAFAAARRLLGWARTGAAQGRALTLRPGGAGTLPVPADARTGVLVPADHAEPYDVRALLRRLVDRGALLELREHWAPNVVTALAHVEGVPVGVVATQPAHLAGALTPQASQKVTEHLGLCRALGLSVLTVVDTPGFLPGTGEEAAGTVRHGARLVSAYADLLAGGQESTRLVTLLTRRAYGGAYVALGSKALSGALVLAWPGARTGVMDAASAVAVTGRRALARERDEGRDPQALHRELVAQQAAREDVRLALEAGWVDEVVTPDRTRARLVRALTGPAPDGSRPRVSTVGTVRHPGDGWVDCSCGHRHWGLNGAAGLLVWRWSPSSPTDGVADGEGRGLEVLLQLRAGWTHRGGTWGLPGGAVADDESPAEAALRETEEETALPARLLTVGGVHVQEHGPWRYSTFAAQAPSDRAWDRLLPVDRESSALAWVPLEAVPGGEGRLVWAPPVPLGEQDGEPVLLPALESVWEGLAALLPQP